MKRHHWHKFIYWLLLRVICPFFKPIMKYSCAKEKGPVSPAIIIANHNTNPDPVLVALGFSAHIYFVASEHTFRKGFWSKVLLRLCAPIPINKSHDDIVAIKEILRRLKAGYNICLFAEGNRSYNGKTWPIHLSTAKLVRAGGADLITYRLEGGYLRAPRWAKNKRAGKMKGQIVGRYAAADIKAMTNEEVLRILERDIYEDAYERQNENLLPYRGRDLAEHIETALYLCPRCKKIGTIHSQGNDFFCACGLKGTYTETGFLTGEDLPYSTIAAWDSWQAEYMALIVANSGEEPLCVDEKQRLYTFQAAQSTALVAEGPMFISRSHFHCAGLEFPLRQITRFAIVDSMTLLFSLKNGQCYEVCSAAPRSALKYQVILGILRNEKRMR